MDAIPWFKVDDGLAFNAKFIALPLSAAGLWVRAGAWCAQQLTDGRIPGPVVAAIGGRPSETDALVAADLWEPTPEGWCFHDWTEYQPAAELVRAERDAAAQRMRERRAKWKGTKGSSGERSEDVQANVQANTGRTFGRSSEEVRDVFGDPDPSLSLSLSHSPSQPTTEGVQGETAPDVTSSGGADAPTKKTPRGTRVPDPFPLDAALVEWAKAKAPNSSPDDHEAFMDFWRGVPGQKGVKLDWPGTWRNWMRKASTEHAPRAGRATPTPIERAAGVAEMAARVAASRQQTHLRAIGDQ